MSKFKFIRFLTSKTSSIPNFSAWEMLFRQLNYSFGTVMKKMQQKVSISLTGKSDFSDSISHVPRS